MQSVPSLRRLELKLKLDSLNAQGGGVITEKARKMKGNREGYLERRYHRLTRLGLEDLIKQVEIPQQQTE
jgi:hypothetical protein